jgi:3-dehydrosphinganine reductase
MNDLNGKTALITGGSSGIGLAMAKLLSGMGVNTWILARDPGKLEKASAEIIAARKDQQQEVLSIAADVSNYEQVVQGLEPFLNGRGVPDVLVNAAGITYPGYFQDLDLQIFRDNMEVNFFGTLYTTKLLVPGMIQRRSGMIINIASAIGIHGILGYSAYCASKFAVVGLTDSLRYDLKPYGIQVSVALPTDTQSPGLELEHKQQPALVKAFMGEMNTPVSPEYVAKNIIKAALRGRYLIKPTNDARLLYIFYRLIPGDSFYKVIDMLIARTRNQAAKNNGSH